MQNIGDNIKKFRELKNLSREQIAAELDLSVSGYSKIERGEVDLTISRIQKIAEILEVDASQILNFDASQIFNVANNKTVQGTGAKANTIYFQGDDYKDKYIKTLERENERLRKIAGE